MELSTTVKIDTEVEVCVDKLGDSIVCSRKCPLGLGCRRAELRRILIKDGTGLGTSVQEFLRLGYNSRFGHRRPVDVPEGVDPTQNLQEFCPFAKVKYDKDHYVFVKDIHKYGE